MKFLKKFLDSFQVFKPNKPALIALGLGAASVLAFAPLYLSPLMVGTLAWLFWLWHHAETRLDFIRIGLWFGLGLFGVGASWLFSSMYFYSNMSFLASFMVTFFVWVLFLSLYTALAGWLVSVFHNKQQPGLSLVVVMPSVWVLAELLRAKLFTGFPFLITGNTHLFTWLDGYAPVFGALGMSWLVAMSAGLLVWLAHYRNWVVGTAVLVMIWLTGAVLQNINWVQPVDKPVDVALLQGNIPQEKKWLKSEFVPTMKTYVRQTKENMDADVIVWPETAIPDYLDRVEKGVLNSFIKDARLLEKDILLGVIVRDKETGQYYNSLVNASDTSQAYHKHHLVPFSEFFPFSDLFKALSLIFDIPFSEFSAGTKTPQPMMLGGQPAGLSVCYEMAFGDELAVNVPDSRYLITVSNDAWFANTLEPFQQVQDVQMRALELGREIARSTNTGHTIIVGVDGRIKQQIPPYEEGVLRGDVQPYEGVTPFVQWKHWPLVWLLVGVFAFLIYNKRQQSLSSIKETLNN